VTSRNLELRVNGNKKLNNIMKNYKKIKTYKRREYYVKMCMCPTGVKDLV